ncbi:MAG: peroxidase [Gemmatimonadetes bacterium]|nr:MAG: peroxidase [Gemmatimonadota bacterium]
MLQQEHPDEDHTAFVEALAHDYRALDLPPLDRAILDYAMKLTRSPGDITPEDVVPLRAQGLDDVAIHDLVSVTAYFAFVNRIADGLGVALEDRWQEDSS